MPRNVDPLLGDDLVDAYRAFLAEIYDRLAAAGFGDLPQAATTLFRDIDGAGSRIADLAVQGGVRPEVMEEIVDQLERSGYVAREGDIVRPIERGHAAFDAGRQALEAAERRLEHHVGAEKLAVFREVLQELAADHPT